MNKKLTFIALLWSVGLMGQASAVTGTYVDISPSNTVAVNGADPWYATASTAGLWQERGFCNMGTVYQGQNANGMDLKTTISDLIPGQVYDIYSVYWSKSIGENWGMLAGVDPNRANATWYNFENGTPTGPIELGSIYEMEALIGTATANKDGELELYVFNHAHITTSQRAWVDGFSYQQAFLTYNPQPGAGEEGVALNTQLSWSPMLDPANPTQPIAGIAEHWVYFSESPYLTSDDLLATVPAPVNQVSAPLEANKRYYWAVDPHFADGTRIWGLIWTFETINTLATFDPPAGSQPENVRADVNETAVFAAAATVPSAPETPITYQWYRGLPGDTSSPLAEEADHISGTQSNQLTIVMAPTDEGSYFCRATSDAGATDSQSATLLLKRLLAWYTFDDSLDDSAGTNRGTMTNPVYVEGMDGKALSFDGTNYVNLGTDAFPKAGFSNGLSTGSASFWINSPKAGQSFVATFNEGSATAFRVDYTAGNWLSFLVRDDNGVGLSAGRNPSGSILNAWHLVTCTWDAESGAAAMYLDGVALAAGTSGQPAEFAAWEYPVLIGARHNRDTVDDYYVGAMDDYRLYNYPLDAYEVAELYTALAGGSICVEQPVGDLNDDCVVDQADLEILRAAWLDCGVVPATACEYKMDLEELATLLSVWLEELGADEGM